MSGNKSGAAKAVKTVLERNPDHHSIAGRIGGLNGRGPMYNGGFAQTTADGREVGRERARVLGAKVGKLSKRGRTFIEIKDGYAYYKHKVSGCIEKYRYWE